MMLDDFSALDFLSMGTFRFLPPPSKPRKGKAKQFAGNLAKGLAKGLRKHSRHAAVIPQEKQGALLPLIGRKLHLPVSREELKGWPVPLSWPTIEIGKFDIDQDARQN